MNTILLQVPFYKLSLFYQEPFWPCLTFFLEEIWNDSQRSPLKRGHLTNEEVYIELISQRLAQGFQIIVFQLGNEPFQQNSVTGNVIPRFLKECVATKKIWKYESSLS